MEIFQPEYFKDFSTFIFSFLTGGVAIVGLFIAFETFKVAKQAKDEWIKQKKFDIDTNGYANSIYALRLIEKLRQEPYDYDFVKKNYENELTYIFENDNSIDNKVYLSFVKFYSYHQYRKSLSNELDEVRRNALIVQRGSDDVSLKNYYNGILNFDANFSLISNDYHCLVLFEFLDKYPAEHLLGLAKDNFIRFTTLDKKTIFEEYNRLFKSVDDPLKQLRNTQISFFKL